MGERGPPGSACVARPGRCDLVGRLDRGNAWWRWARAGAGARLPHARSDALGARRRGVARVRGGRGRSEAHQHGPRAPTPGTRWPTWAGGSRSRPRWPPRSAMAPTWRRPATRSVWSTRPNRPMERTSAGAITDALRFIKPVAAEVPAVAAVRELAGLAAYRAGRWREAARHLEALRTLEDSSDHLPVLMDCQRALHKPRKVADLWAELRQSSPDPDVLAEGRIVAAASLADAGDLQGAITLLAGAGASRALRNPSGRHVRQWYVLGDLYERAGDVPRARQYFERVGKAEPQAYDVSARLAALGSTGRPRRSRPAPRVPPAEATRSRRCGRFSVAPAGTPVGSRHEQSPRAPRRGRGRPLALHGQGLSGREPHAPRAGLPRSRLQPQRSQPHRAAQSRDPVQPRASRWHGIHLDPARGPGNRALGGGQLRQEPGLLRPAEPAGARAGRRVQRGGDDPRDAGPRRRGPTCTGSPSS